MRPRGRSLGLMKTTPLPAREDRYSRPVSRAGGKISIPRKILTCVRHWAMLQTVALPQRKAGVDQKRGENPMWLPVASAALAAAFVLTPVAAGYAPALCQDFSITNPAESGNAARRDLMRQLQAWWEVHAYYPRHASNNDEGGTVKLHLEIQPDGRIWAVNLVESSGSRSLDAAGVAVFRDVFVRPFPGDEPKADIDISLRYVL